MSFLVRRTLWLMLILFVISLMTFLMMHAVPGGPFSLEKALPAATLEQLNQKYHLDDPLYAQYLDFVSDLIVPRLTRGEQSRYLDHAYLINVPLGGEAQATLRWVNFGPSFKSTSRTVNDIFRDNLPISMQLGAASIIIALLMGIPLGIISALRRNTWIDYLATALAIVGISVPVIVTAPVLLYLFGIRLGWLPVTGWGGWRYMILPALALGFAQSALFARLTRASMLEVLGQDYIRTARAKGLPRRRVTQVHALRNAILPVMTMLGPSIAFVITGTFVVETIFGIPGMGKFLSPASRDGIIRSSWEPFFSLP